MPDPDHIRKLFDRYPEMVTKGDVDGIVELYADDASGDAWQLEQLSRGTREQVFLSLRLALISGFAQRGIQVPTVLDDV